MNSATSDDGGDAASGARKRVRTEAEAGAGTGTGTASSSVPADLERAEDVVTACDAADECVPRVIDHDAGALLRLTGLTTMEIGPFFYEYLLAKPGLVAALVRMTFFTLDNVSCITTVCAALDILCRMACTSKAACDRVASASSGVLVPRLWDLVKLGAGAVGSSSGLDGARLDVVSLVVSLGIRATLTLAALAIMDPSAAGTSVVLYDGALDAAKTMLRHGHRAARGAGMDGSVVMASALADLMVGAVVWTSSAAWLPDLVAAVVEALARGGDMWPPGVRLLQVMTRASRLGLDSGGAQPPVVVGTLVPASELEDVAVLAARAGVLPMLADMVRGVAGPVQAQAAMSLLATMTFSHTKVQDAVLAHAEGQILKDALAYLSRSADMALWDQVADVVHNVLIRNPAAQACIGAVGGVAAMGSALSVLVGRVRMLPRTARATSPLLDTVKRVLAAMVHLLVGDSGSQDALRDSAVVLQDMCTVFGVLEHTASTYAVAIIRIHSVAGAARAWVAAGAIGQLVAMVRVGDDEQRWQALGALRALLRAEPDAVELVVTKDVDGLGAIATVLGVRRLSIGGGGDSGTGAGFGSGAGAGAGAGVRSRVPATPGVVASALTFVSEVISCSELVGLGLSCSDVLRDMPGFVARVQRLCIAVPGVLNAARAVLIEVSPGAFESRYADDSMRLLSLLPSRGQAPAPPASAPAAAAEEEEEAAQDLCPVCMCPNDDCEDGDRAVQLACSHAYHTKCLHQWLQTADSCPMCRVPVLPAIEAAYPDAV
jgi:hypothetical protein